MSAVMRIAVPAEKVPAPGMRTLFEPAGNSLALFNVALDTSLRGSDLVRLRVSDVATPGGIRALIEIRQKKTGFLWKFLP